MLVRNVTCQACGFARTHDAGDDTPDCPRCHSGLQVGSEPVESGTTDSAVLSMNADLHNARLRQIRNVVVKMHGKTFATTEDRDAFLFARRAPSAFTVDARYFRFLQVAQRVGVKVTAL